MIEQTPADPPSPYSYYPPPPVGWMPPPRTHAEMNWMDLASFLIALFTFGFLAPLALILAWGSFAEAKQVSLKQHAIGTVGFILGAAGTVCWFMFLVFMVIGVATS